MNSPLVELRSFSFTYAGARQATLRDVSLLLHSGACHCLTGATGSGKSTLALALKGLLPHGSSSGYLQRPAAAESGRAGVGLVMQNPETQLFADSIGEEVAFGLENLAVPAADMASRVLAALQAVGLDRPLSGPVVPLSMGEKYRLLLAATLVMRPQLLILDEPAAQLDSAGLRDLRQVLTGLKQAGIAILICEHRPSFLFNLIDHFWRLDEQGRLHPGLHTQETEAQPFVDNKSRLPGEVVVINASGLASRRGMAGEIWKDASFQVRRGERVLVQGSNGAGKSTLLHLLAGLQPPSRGNLAVLGRKPSLAGLRGRLACLLQNPQKQLFEDSVAAEVGFVLRRAGGGRTELAEKVSALLETCGLQHLADASPHKLSFGQKHLVALASVLASGPELLLLDDPFAGLDDASLKRAWALLLERNSHGTTLVWTSHHADEICPCPHAVLRVEGGTIVRQSV